LQIKADQSQQNRSSLWQFRLPFNNNNKYGSFSDQNEAKYLFPQKCYTVWW